MEREKQIKSGRLLEAEFFPVFKDGRRMPERAPLQKRSSEAQQKYNQQQAVKKTIRLINANFEKEDLFVHLTYNQESAPQTYEEANRDITNYIRRYKRKRDAELIKVKKQLKDFPNDKGFLQKFKLLSKPFKYYISEEEVTYKTGKKQGKTNYHFHIFLTGGLDRDTTEDMWGKGIRVNADRFQPERFGPEAAARYISKDTCGHRRFRYSKNLEKPVTKVKDGKITRGGVERLATQRVDDREYWENRYKGYRFIRCFPRFNKFNSHWYLSVIMYKVDSTEPLAQWSVDCWNDEY